MASVRLCCVVSSEIIKKWNIIVSAITSRVCDCTWPKINADRRRSRATGRTTYIARQNHLIGSSNRMHKLWWKQLTLSKCNSANKYHPRSTFVRKNFFVIYYLKVRTSYRSVASFYYASVVNRSVPNFLTEGIYGQSWSKRSHRVDFIWTLREESWPSCSLWLRIVLILEESKNYFPGKSNFNVNRNYGMQGAPLHPQALVYQCQAIRAIHWVCSHTFLRTN